MVWGRPSVYFPLGEHVNVYYCCWQTKYSGVMATSHVICHITKLLSSCRQILQYRFRENQYRICSPSKVAKSRRFCIPAACIIPPLTCTYAVKQPQENCVSAQHQYYCPHKCRWRCSEGNLYMDQTMYEAGTVNKYQGFYTGMAS